jgi:hypothetical protein
MTLATGLTSPAFVATDAANVYWGDLAEATILAMPLAGGGSHVLVSGLDGLSGLVVRDGRVYGPTTRGPPLGSRASTRPMRSLATRR